MVAGIISALLVGTGGAATADYYKLRGSRGYVLGAYDLPNDTVLGAQDRTLADDLARIRAILKPAVKDLARMVGVSRQAIYDWQSGATVASKHAARITDLARAADLFAAEGLTATSQMLRRPIAVGRSFFDLVNAGESAEDAARSLIRIVRREVEQRKTLASRLSDRPKQAIPVDDFGAPMLDEQG